jgi:hypothetical protein
MKLLLPVCVFAVSLLTISFSTKNLNKKTKEQDGFALVELFTSEGCSSCPPADALLEEVQKKYSDKNVLAVAYHVDYWDKLGWKDLFSNALFTERQEYYSNIFRLNSIYTPQVVVNGRKEFLGSNKAKLISSIDEQLTERSAASINLKVTLKSPEKFEVHYSGEAVDSKNEQLILLLVQKMATNKIMRGENEGRTLHHINIVRGIFHLAETKEARKTFDLPQGLKREDVFIVGFIQDKKSGKIKVIRSSPVE